MKILALITLLASSAFSEDLITGSQKLSVVLYQGLSDKNPNLVVSPFGVQNLLAIVKLGARGATADEIRDSSYLPDSEDDLESVMQTFLTTINSCINLGVNNSFLINKQISISDDFSAVASKIYQTTITNDMDSSTDLFNNIMFNGQFATPFVKQDMVTGFNVDGNTVVDYEPLYLNAGEFSYAEVEELDAKILEIPFSNCEDADASIVIVLPNEIEGLSAVEANLELAYTTPAFNKQVVEVTIPRFPFTGLIHDLIPILKNMGIAKAFLEDADFSGISDEPKGLHLIGLSQYAALDIEAEGISGASSEDGAFSKVKARLGKFIKKQVATKTFVADHPFLFYAKLNDVIVLAGRVVEPKQKM